MAEKSEYSLGFLITKVGRVATKMYAEHLEELGLTPLQGGILMTVDSLKGLNQKQLMSLLQVDKGTIHQMLKGLVSKKLIVMKSFDGDRRQLSISITTLGRSLLPRVAKIDKVVSNELLSRISPKYRRQLQQSLLEVYKSFKS